MGKNCEKNLFWTLLDPRIIELEIDDEVIEGIALILAACEKCYQHINGNLVDSEYINIASLSAILTRLEKIFEKIDMELPEGNFLNDYVNMNTSRFGVHYNMLKAAFNMLNPPRKRIDKREQGYREGHSDGHKEGYRESVRDHWFMGQSFKP